MVGGRRLHPGRSQIKGMVDGPRRRKAEARQRPTVALREERGPWLAFPLSCLWVGRVEGWRAPEAKVDPDADADLQ